MKNYYGLQTKKARENFPYSLPPVSLDLIYAITEIKKAAACVNRDISAIPKEIANAILAVTDEILKGRHDRQFITSSLQGGAGTSINMNVNEVIAARATEIVQKKQLRLIVHPLDHVNLHQSTNDVNPSALRIVCIRQAHRLIIALDSLVSALRQQAIKYKTIKKLGRTHLQDAVPTTFGQVFISYADALERDGRRVKQARDFLYELNLGGTAIGNKINSSVEFIRGIYPYLQEIVDIPVKPAKNLMTLTSSSADFCNLSAAIHTLSIDLTKIATDIRFLSSGPQGGIGEIILPEMQAGSSIMPGKVNPVIPEAINQTYYFISGKHLSITQASANSHLELAVMFPVIADAIIAQFKVMTTSITLFAEKCVQVMEVNEDKCEQLLEKSTAYATLFTKKFGYDTIATIVKEAAQTGNTFHEIMIEKKLITEKEFQEIVNGY